MTDPLQHPGVSGLAQLGRNAIERVTELERELADAIEERELFRQMIAEQREHLDATSARLAALAELEAELAATVSEQNRMAREIDEALCGDSAARQASLCDLVMPVRMLRIDRDELRARLAAIDAAPTVAVVESDCDQGAVWPTLEYGDLPPYGTELIARPEAK